MSRGLGDVYKRQVYPKSNLIIAKDAGHSVLEPTISKELVKIFDDII